MTDRMDTENEIYRVSQLSNKELADYILKNKQSKDIITSVFILLPINCVDRHRIDPHQLDQLITHFHSDTNNRNQILTQIIAVLRSAMNSKPTNLDLLVRNIQEYIQQNLNEDISIEEIANHFNLSFFYMCHLFKNITGITVSAFRNQERIKKAKSLLISTDESITDIAFCCGFSSSSYFTETFAKFVGISPKVFRQNRGSTFYFPSYTWEDQALADMLSPIQLLFHISADELQADSRVKTHPVIMPDSEYTFLHEAALIEYHGTLFASWYNNPQYELNGRTPIRGRRSHDGGKTWSPVEVIVDDPTEKILYCPPVYGICNDRLYLLINEMVAPDHIHALDLFIYDNEKDCFRMLWSKPIPFKLNTNVCTLPNGKLMLSGRVGELDRFPNTPAVLISDCGEIDTDWRLIKIAENGNLPDGAHLVHPEISSILCDHKIYMFCRNDLRRIPLLYISEDNGETWSAPYAHNIPFHNSKIYSGTLSDGRNYVIGNIGGGRSQLAIFFSRPGTMHFDSGILLQNGSHPDFLQACMWHYPMAVEFDGELKIICTLSLRKEISNDLRGAVLISVPLD